MGGKITDHHLFISLVLTSLGEKLSDAEADELLKGVEVDKSGRVHYEGKCVGVHACVF